MLNSATTITWEAWDQKYKPNQDWNHARGAAPENLFPRFVLGVTPQTPGWSEEMIRPCPGNLSSESGLIPTLGGPILVDWNSESKFKLSIALPTDVKATIERQAADGLHRGDVDGQSVQADRRGDRWILAKPISCSAEIEMK